MEDVRPEYKKKSIRSYVVRSGRMTDGQKLGFHDHWPNYGLSLHQGLLNFQSEFGRNAPQVLEIGFGMGGSLLSMIQLEPDKDFVGIEVHAPGVGRLISDAGKLSLQNVRVYMADAIDVIEDCIPDASIHRVQVYFPDPWHKTRHHKRRIVQRDFVQNIRTKLAIGGTFHMATDWQHYAEHMMDVMTQADGFENTSSEETTGYVPRPDYRPITKFEVRGQKLGHGVWDLIFKRVS